MAVPPHALSLTMATRTAATAAMRSSLMPPIRRAFQDLRAISGGEAAMPIRQTQRQCASLAVTPPALNDVGREAVRAPPAAGVRRGKAGVILIARCRDPRGSSRLTDFVVRRGR